MSVDKESPASRRVSVRVPLDLFTAIEIRARDGKMKLSACVVTLLRFGLEKKEKTK